MASSLQILTNIDKRGLVKSFGSDEEVIKRGNVKGTATIYPNHTISFEIYPICTNVEEYMNILRFTVTEKDCTTQGDRSPSVWFYPNTLNLHVVYGRDGDGHDNFNYGFEKVTTALTKFQWSKIDLVVQNQSAKDDMVLLVFINGQFAMEQSLQGFRSWIKPEGTVHQVWASDNFYNPASAMIRNLAVYTPLVGRTIAIYADNAQSFLFVDDGNITQWRSKSDTPANVSQIAFDGIKFKVVDAGGGYVALWNVYRKRFLGINTSGTVECVKVSPAGDSSDVFDQKCTWEKFSITEIPLRKGLYTIYVPGPVDYSLGVEPGSYNTYGKKGQYRPHWQFELFSIHVVA